eukprot:GHVR01020150.1.p1 GENE.GHVR01020150.1~~GHVR01020150.1.p1  ORF type:complete len:858 (+),score=204.17 GHVR01020150.1:2595-5168(+)
MTRSDNNNMMTANDITNTRVIYNQFRDININDNNKTSFFDLCLKVNNECMIRSVHGSFPDTEALPTTDSDMLTQINSKTRVLPGGEPLTNRLSMLLGSGVYDSSGKVQTAKVLLHEFISDVNTEDRKRQHLAWESQLIDGVTSYDTGGVYRVYIEGDRSLDDAISESTSGNSTILMAIAFTIVCTYACVSRLKFKNFQQSQSGVAFGGCGVVALAVGTGFGIFSVCGGRWVTLCGIAPFLLLGVGVDDMFIIMDHFNSTTVRDLPPGLRTATALSHAGPSITMTTITDIVVFLLGLACSFPAVVQFSACLVCTIAVDFIYQVTIFVSLLYLDALRLDKGYLDFPLYFIKKHPQDKKPVTHTHTHTDIRLADVSSPTAGDANVSDKPKIEDARVGGGRNSSVGGGDMERGVRRRSIAIDLDEEDNNSIKHTNTNNKENQIVHDEQCVVETVRRDDEFKYSLASFIKYSYAPLVTKKWFQLLTILLFVSVWVVGGVGWSRLKEGLDNRNLLPQGFYLDNTIVLQREHYKHTLNAVPISVSISFDPSKRGMEDAPTRQEYKKIEDDLIRSQYIQNNSLSTWREGFYSYCSNEATCDTSSSYAGQVNKFVDIPQGAQYKEHVKINGQGEASRLTSTRVSITSEATPEYSVLGEMMLDVRRVLDSYESVLAPVGGEAIIHSNSFFYFEQFIIIREQTALTVGLSLLGVLVIVFLFLGVGVALFGIILVVIIVDCMVIGYMSWWGVSLDSISFINLVMAVGFVVDYTAHLIHSFENINLKNKENMSNSEIRGSKSIIALQKVGVAVFYGASSTLLATIPLAFSSSYIFFTFFRMFFLTILFGMSHGLLLIPVLLALLGPVGKK